MQAKLVASAIILVGLTIGTTVFFSNSATKSDNISQGDSTSIQRADVGQAVVEDGVQYVDITARGGYTPRVTKAKAGVQTVIRMTTQNTYDCSSALVIPDIDYQTYLPQTGVTEIPISPDKAQGKLRGMCSMAMYNFEIEFE